MEKTVSLQFTCCFLWSLSYYVNLMMCLEVRANNTCCTDASFRHHMLMDIHKEYFSLCFYMKDPGVPILLLLIVPCSIAPFIIAFLCQCFKTSS